LPRGSNFKSVTNATYKKNTIKTQKKEETLVAQQADLLLGETLLFLESSQEGLINTLLQIFYGGLIAQPLRDRRPREAPLMQFIRTSHLGGAVLSWGLSNRIDSARTA